MEKENAQNSLIHQHSKYQLKKYQNNAYPLNKETVQGLFSILDSNQEAKNVVFQYPLSLINTAFEISRIVKENYKSRGLEVFTLFDSMKNPCCTDVIGAEHINYDLLVHFGEACFSETLNLEKHFYLLPTISQENQNKLREILGNCKDTVDGKSEQKCHFLDQIIENKIGIVLAEQSMYKFVKNIFLQNKNFESHVEIMKLPFDAQETDTYMLFGYYLSEAKLSKLSNRNVLVMFENEPQGDNKLLSDLHLSLSYLKEAHPKIFPQTPELFKFYIESPKIQASNIDYSKKLMSRLSLIGQLEKYDTFGILASNVNTEFCQKSIKRCQEILSANGKKHFLFMMNNLNEVKLGNFPQIEVYVIISCFNYSCYTQKDFCRLVVAPIDLEVAFNGVGIGQYNFDLKGAATKFGIQQGEGQTDDEHVGGNEAKQGKEQSQISVQQKKQVMLKETLQTLDFYRHKLYKGLDFSEEKEIQPIKKGKVGLAEQYTPLQSVQGKK